MATKAQKRKERKKQKREQKKKEFQKAASRQDAFQKQSTKQHSPKRHRRRTTEQKPEAWQGEWTEDVAIFDEEVLAGLPSDLKNEALTIRNALEMACGERGRDALELTTSIPRKSPYSEWRLYLKGLVPWLNGEYDEAEAAWKRLDTARRPGRIAIAMMNALRDDLDRVSINESANAVDAPPSGDWSDSLDPQLLYQSKLLRRTRFDRTGLRIAKSVTTIPGEFAEKLIDERHVDWVADFADEFRQSEPALVEALERELLRQAFAQNYPPLFEQARAKVRGPRHDRRNSLLAFFYYHTFDPDDRVIQKEIDRTKKQFLEKDLPRNEELSIDLRNAIASQFHLNEANRQRSQAMPNSFFPFMPPMDAGSPSDEKEIRESFRAAIEAYPAHRHAHVSYSEWIRDQLENEWLKKDERKPWERELADVMARWSESIPDEIEPRLWLVDYLLENERTAEALPHVEWLANCRHDDPRVRSINWKWELLEAMRLGRRKAWLKQVPEHLEAADRLWPSWLSKQWLPYLEAAWALRSGNTAEYERCREEIRQQNQYGRDSLPDACMMLAAAQQMRVPAAELKPLRAPVDNAVKNLKRIETEELFQVAPFFWDLWRTHLKYPAYRMHGGKFARELWDRILAKPALITKEKGDAQVREVLLWCAAHKTMCDDNNRSLRFPRSFRKSKIRTEPYFAAVQLYAFLHFRSLFNFTAHESARNLLEEAAPREADAYYRYWYEKLVREFDERVEWYRRTSQLDISMLESMFGLGGDDDLGDDFDDEDF